MPDAPSGTYAIEPDGSGTMTVFCDMTTMPVGGSAGGWTLVFVPTDSNYNTITLDYTSYASALLSGATEALIANRKADLSVAGSHASFPLPDPWKTEAPFKIAAQDMVLAVTITGPNQTGHTSVEQLRFGFSNWSTDCAGAWSTSGPPWGRICIAGTILQCVRP